MKIEFILLIVATSIIAPLQEACSDEIRSEFDRAVAIFDDQSPENLFLVAKFNSLLPLDRQFEIVDGRDSLNRIVDDGNLKSKAIYFGTTQTSPNDIMYLPVEVRDLAQNVFETASVMEPFSSNDEAIVGKNCFLERKELANGIDVTAVVYSQDEKFLCRELGISLALTQN